MAGKCSKEGCYPEIRCKLGESQKKNCENWENNEKDDVNNTEGIPNEENSYLLTWSGNSMGLDDVSMLSERSEPILVGSIGPENSGKTTFLGLLYLLLTNGNSLEDWGFSHSYSLLGWEYIANYLRYQADNNPEFPPHTTSFEGRKVGLLHLGLKNDNVLNDLLLTDVPGEWFTNWAIDVKGGNVGNAPWIHEKSQGFYFLIDCEGLKNKPGKYRNNTLSLIHRFSNSLRGRPVAVLWSKADVLEDVKKPIENVIRNELENFQNYKEFRVSVYKDEGFHEMILESLGWLLQNILNPKSVDQIEIPTMDSRDLFIFFRGSL